MYLKGFSAAKIHIHHKRLKVNRKHTIHNCIDKIDSNLNFTNYLAGLTQSLGHSSSTISLAPPKYPIGTMRITDQVIEEVDEQLTIQSMHRPDMRPTAQSLFASSDDKPPARSAPIDVPASHHNDDQNGYARVQSVMQPEHHPYMFPNNTIFSSSAPEGNTTPIQTPKINVDHFDDLMRRGSKDSDNKEGKIIQFFFLNFHIQLLLWLIFNFQLRTKKMSIVHQIVIEPIQMYQLMIILSNCVSHAKKNVSKDKSKKLLDPSVNNMVPILRSTLISYWNN